MPKSKEYVYNLFNSIAEKYDFLNDLISLKRHKQIKKSAVKKIPVKSGMKILDVCTGTGDIAIYFSEIYGVKIEIIGVDFSENMLSIAKKRSLNFQNLQFIKGDALNLPFEDESFDVVFISFGLRNLEDIEKGILEMKRVTKPGGYFSSLDMGKPQKPFKNIFRLYFFSLVPLWGKIFCKDNSPYKYLPESTKEFPSPDELVKLFYEAGFKEIKNYNYAFGALAQQITKK
jgi:demethylmenaquinone methyltransferase/2-methoxy-6-polyprenyl-1,4-benzoquinol methylase